jgi:hypothetical protein
MREALSQLPGLRIHRLLSPNMQQALYYMAVPFGWDLAG